MRKIQVRHRWRKTTIRQWVGLSPPENTDKGSSRALRDSTGFCNRPGEGYIHRKNESYHSLSPINYHPVSNRGKTFPLDCCFASKKKSQALTGEAPGESHIPNIYDEAISRRKSDAASIRSGRRRSISSTANS